MGPGPSSVPPPVYEALGSSTLGHLDPDFIDLMDDIKSMLAKLFRADSGLTLPLSGTGSAGMEATFVNLVESGDRVLILKNGVFGNRMEDVATRLGAEVETLDYPWGKPVVVQDLREKLASTAPYKIVAAVHAETSTGVANPVAEIAEALRDNDALFLVDCVTSLGGMDVDVTGCGIDAAYSGTQKCLSCPPGLSPVHFSERAVEVIRSRRSKVPNWYLDVTMLLDYWTGETRVYHHTAPVNHALRTLCRGGSDSGRRPGRNVSASSRRTPPTRDWPGRDRAHHVGRGKLQAADAQCGQGSRSGERGWRSGKSCAGNS